MELIGKILFIAVALLALLAVLASVSLPVRRVTLYVLRNILYTLYLNGNDNAYLKVRLRHTNQKMRIYKRIHAVDDVHLVAAIPKTLYSEHVRSVIEFSEAVRDPEKHSWSNEEVLAFDCGGDYEKALRIIVACAGDAARPFDGRCDVRMVGMYPDMNIHPGFSA